MKTEWKDIPGYEGYYQASKDGLIRSCDRTIIDVDGNYRQLSAKILRPSKNKCGYLRVVLCKNNIHTYLTVHHLIAITFIQKDISPSMVINHIDGNKLNNQYKNLEIVTQKENRRHAIRNGLWNQRGSHSSRAKLTDADIQMIRELRQAQAMTYTTLSKMFNVGTSTIARIVAHKSYKNYVD